MTLLRGMAETAKRPLSALIVQFNGYPDLWRKTMAWIDDANRDGLRFTGQVGSRPVGMLMGLEATLNPFLKHHAFQEIHDLPLEAKVARLRDDVELRQRLLAERRWKPADWRQAGTGDFQEWMDYVLTRLWELETKSGPNYMPSLLNTVVARAQALGVEPYELALDLMLKDGGRNYLYFGHENYARCTTEDLYDMLMAPNSIMGIGDAGAHCSTICEGGWPTFLLSYWARDRCDGPHIPIEKLVRKMTADTSQSFGLLDRGLLAPGYKADINIIDFERLAVETPSAVYDLPLGGRRILQRARGWCHTFVSGVEVSCEGVPTGQLPGVLVRGERPPPEDFKLPMQDVGAAVSRASRL